MPPSRPEATTSPDPAEDLPPSGRPEYSVADTLDTVAARVPRALVSGRAWRAVRQAAEMIPAALTDGIYLECRLAGGDSPVDLILRVGERGRGALALLPPPLRDHPVWARVRELGARWEAASPGALECVDHLWLEFDLDGGGGALPVPSLFVAPGTEAVRSLRTEEWMALLESCAAVLLPGGLPAPTRETLHGVISARPDGGGIPYLGFMLARSRPAVRVYFSGVDEARAEETLRRAGWPGAEGEIADVLARLGSAESRPDVGMVHLDVDGGAVLPRAGIEYTFERRAQLRGGIAEAAFLDHLADAGLCDPDRGDALRAWPGWETRRLRHELWESRVVRRTNCVKLVLDAGLPPHAKGYLLTSHRPAARLPSTR